MLAFDGAEQIAVDEQGDLVLTLLQSSVEAAEGTAPTLRLHKPVVYQKDGQGERHLLAGTYVLKAATAHQTVALHLGETPQVGFQVASYDATKPLIIDPVLSWATYLGGSNVERGQGIAVDQAGNAYVTGFTSSSDFPGTAGSPIQSTFGGDDDAFVTKLDAAGTAILYSTYLGGNRIDQGLGITVDAAGNAYVTGNTDSANFPGTAGSSIQSTLGGDVNGDAFVTKLNAAGTAIVYSTYLGGRLGDVGSGIAVDVAGNVYVTGETVSDNFPGAAGSPIQNTLSSIDAFVTKLNATGTALLYSTYLGGRSSDVGTGIAVDAAGNAYVTGATNSENFPGTAASPIQSTPDSLTNAFVTKLNVTGTTIVYSTYLGGGGLERGEAIAVDAAGNAYVTGYTTSDNFLGTTGSAIQNTMGGEYDAFVTKLNAAGTAIVYSTYLGSSGTDLGNKIAVDQAGTTYVTGWAGTGFPGTAGSLIQSTISGLGDAFVAKISSTTAPTCSAAKAVPAVLWSLNHQFVPITVAGVTDPEGHTVTITVTGVTQDELVNAKGDGNTSPDAVIHVGAASVRAERSGKGNGRVYELSFKADNGQGGVCTGAVKVGVPHSLQKGATAIDDGQVYDSTVP